MERSTAEELYTGKGCGAKCGGIMHDPALLQVPKNDDPQRRTELPIQHTLLLAEQIRKESDLVSGLPDTKPLSGSAREVRK